ncbi:MAG: hypothetical protein AAF433_03220 [Bacteroidota bacterium]
MTKHIVLTFSLIAAIMSLSSMNWEDNPDNWERFQIDFFGEKVSLEFDPAMRVLVSGRLDHGNIERSYRSLRQAPQHVFLRSLNTARERYQLNDYLYYILARNSLALIYQGDRTAAREIHLFGLLADAGFDVRLTFRGQRAYVNVYTQDELFEVPIIDDSGRSYANISCLKGECGGRQSLYIFRQRPNPGGRSFNFQLKQWPELHSQPKQRQLLFDYHGQQQQLAVTYDRTMVDIMRDYPFVDEYCYLETPFSPLLRESLLPQLERWMEGLNIQQQLELLASFTRSAFSYKEDNEHFGHSKPMVPEEVFGYDYSDCEDRSALFFALVRDLLDLPMAVVAYDDHLTVAVATDQVAGDDFYLDGQRYIFVDPTGPSNSSQIGQIPPGYENREFTIIGRYK